MKYFLILFFIMIAVGTSVFKNKKLNPIIQEPTMPGTTVPIEDLRTSPNPTPAELESDKSRGILKTEDKEEQQEGDQQLVPPEN
jgi:hypothetical protein